MTRFLFLSIFVLLACAPAREATDTMDERVIQREMGRRIFFDKRFSSDASMSCSSCHLPEFAFADRRSLPVGVTGETLARNSPSLLYSGKFQKFTWANPVLDTLERQVLVPLFGENPPEQSISSREHEIYAEIFADGSLDHMRGELCDDAAQEYPDRSLIVRSLVVYLQSLEPFQSPYDRYLTGEIQALSQQQLTGRQLFFGQAACHECHSGRLFNGQQEDSQGRFGPNIFRRNGLLNRAKTAKDPLGMGEFTGDLADWNLVRVPSLRNVTLTAPYLHDGSVADLMEVLRAYNEARKLQLSEGQLSDLKEFLAALSDPLEALMQLALPSDE